MDKIIRHYVLPTDPLTLDELTTNSHEKSIMADRLINLMSNQFIGCPLMQPVVPIDPSPRDRDLLQGLALVAAHDYLAPLPIPRDVFQLANAAWYRSRLLLEQMENDTRLDFIILVTQTLIPISITSTLTIDSPNCFASIAPITSSSRLTPPTRPQISRSSAAPAFI